MSALRAVDFGIQALSSVLGMWDTGFGDRGSTDTRVDLKV